MQRNKKPGHAVRSVPGQYIPFPGIKHNTAARERGGA